MLDRAYPALDAVETLNLPVPTAAPPEGPDLKQWLALELHDSVVQALSTMVIEMEHYKLTRRAAKRDVRHLDHLQAVARETLRGLRDTIDELRGEYQPDVHLAKAVCAVAERLHEETGIGTALSIAPEWPAAMPRALARNLYRIVEEALNNVRLHSRAAHVTISMWTAGQTGVISVLDDGIGFQERGRPARALEGLGLVGMRERAALIGASLRVEAEPGEGTQVSVTFPLPDGR